MYNKFLKKLEKYKKKYININHKEFCKNKKEEEKKDLKFITNSDTVLIDYNIIIRLPIMVIDKNFSESIYQSQKIKFETKLFKQNISFNNYNFNFNAEKITFDNIFKYEDIVDLQWIKETNKYIQTLTPYQINLIYYYTIGPPYMKNIENIFQIILNIKTKKDLEKSRIIYDFYFYEYIFPFVSVVLDKYNDEIYSFIDIDSETINSDKKIIIMNEEKYSIKQIIKHFKNIKNIKYFNEIKNLFNLNFYFKVIKQVQKEYYNIFYNAPVTNKDMIFYRGTKTHYIKGNIGNIYKTDKIFTSISMELKTAINFINIDNKCCLYRIIIPKKTRLLLGAGLSMYPEQLEVLIPLNIKFYVFNKNKKLANLERKKIEEEYNYPETPLCPSNTEIYDVYYLGY